MERLAKPHGWPSGCRSGSGPSYAARARSRTGSTDCRDAGRVTTAASANSQASSVTARAGRVDGGGDNTETPSATGRIGRGDDACGNPETRQGRQVQRRGSSHGTRGFGSAKAGSVRRTKIQRGVRFSERAASRPGSGEDRLSAGHAGLGPRPRGRPRSRHREAGGTVRRDSRDLWHSAR